MLSGDTETIRRLQDEVIFTLDRIKALRRLSAAALREVDILETHVSDLRRAEDEVRRRATPEPYGAPLLCSEDDPKED